MIGSVVAEAESGTIVERAVAGDEVAFAQIVATHHIDMARIAYLVVGDLDIAEEAERSAWAVACRRLGDLRDPDRLRPWLMTIAANEARQIARSRRRRVVRELAVTGQAGRATSTMPRWTTSARMPAGARCRRGTQARRQFPPSASSARQKLSQFP